MRYTVEHRMPGRLRVSLKGRIPAPDACALSAIVEQWEGVRDLTLYPRTGSLAITYDAALPDAEAQLLDRLGRLATTDVAQRRPSEAQLRAQPHRFDRSLSEQIAWLVLRRLAARLLLPAPLRLVYQIGCSLAFVAEAARSLARARVDVPVLDAAAIGASLVQGKGDDAASTMFLLTLGELMEEHARDRTQLELINSLLEVPERVWLQRPKRAGGDVLVDAGALAVGDRIVVRTGSPVPVDGVILEGRALVNQNSLTGEPLAIERSANDSVFAGTVVEEGELVVEVTSAVGNTRLRQVVSLVEQSEAHRSESQIRLEGLADRFVPYNFLYAGLLLLLTRSLARASTALMVDYSCALKLTGSISSLAALREAARAGITVKGARSLEELARADTLVFDKTGTLTQTTPRVSDVIAFGTWEQREVLRLAACLEEHFPHPVARAVVNEATAQGLNHREKHAAVSYLVAHGIASTLDGKRVIIGSGHFVFEDEGVPYPAAKRRTVERRAAHGSPLFLAVDGELVGALCISDPLKPGVAATVTALRAQGFRRIVMLTGDNAATAAHIAREAGIEEFGADLLPEQKHAFLEGLRASGARVVMVGDGVNDSPALSCADVGIAMGNGAAIAREVANITLSSGELGDLVALRRLGVGLDRRMRRSFRWIMLLNTALLALGGLGLLQAGTSSLIHNGSTVLLCANSARSYQRA